MLEIKELTITELTGRVLIDNLNFVLNESDKMAIIGEEGNGKSTLIKAICNIDMINSYVKLDGIIYRNNHSIGYLEQAIDQKWLPATIDEFFLKEDPNDEINYEQYNELHKVSKVLSSLHLNTAILESEQTISTLSGGEKVKLQIAKILLKDPDILLLDEPTNDLDIETLCWLERFMINCKKPIIFISHDETLLENVATSILHLEQVSKKTKPKWTLEKMSYLEYVEYRFAALNKQDQIARDQRRQHKEKEALWREIYQKVEHQQNQAVRNPSLGRLLKKKMHGLKAQKRRLDNQEFTDMVDVEEAINFFFEVDTVANSKTIIDFQLPQLEISNKILAKKIELFVKGQEKVVIIGKNGSGKTTLINKIYQCLKIRSDLKVGYMPQNYELLLDNDKTALEFLIENFKTEDESWIRQYLGSVKFTRDEMVSKIVNLSGGQKAKLILIYLIINQYNVLILDEPTRNLSPLSNPILRDALKEFKGSIISISHDRKYIDEVIDTIYELTNQGLIKRDSY